MSRTVDLRKKTEQKETTPVAEKMSLVRQEIQEATKKVSTLTTNPIPEKTNRFEWEAPSFYHNPHKKYITLLVITLLVGASIVFFYHIDTLTVIFLILSSLVLILYANKKPGVSKVIVNQAGITIDNRVYNYRDLKSFWLDYDPHGSKELSLEPKNWYLPYFKISIENQNPSELRSLMISFINEKEHEKSLVDLISRKIGL